MIAHSSQSWAFDELEPGTYTVEVRDPRYLPWSQSGVTPGTEVRARLKGSAAVTLSVLGDGGAPVDDYILRVDYHTSRTTPHVFDLRAAKAPMPASGVYDGLIPDDLTLHIEASGYTNCDVIVAALLPNERRAVTAQLDHGSSLRGVVLDATTRAPVSGVDVALGAYIEDAEDSPARFNKFQSLLDARHNSRTTKSDASGHFSFDSVPHAAYELRARLGPLVHIELAPVVLDGGERSVELVLPASGFLVGRLIGPDGARFDGLSLSAQRSTPQVDKFAAFLESSSIEGGSRASVESDGNFRLGPLPAGEIVVRLDYPEVEMATGFNSSMGTPGPQRVLGTVVIEPGGDTRHDFDLRESFPGSLSVSIHVDGQLGASLVVIAVLDPEKAMSQGNMSSATSDASGVARLAPLPPGSWTISVRPIDSIWTWTAPVPVEISAGQQRELSADIALVEDEITLVRDQDRKPFVTRGFVIKTSGGLIISVKSDGAGRVKLRLPPGHYQIADAGESEFGWAGDSEFTALEWGTTGPLEKVLRVRQADKRD